MQSPFNSDKWLSFPIGLAGGSRVGGSRPEQGDQLAAAVLGGAESSTMPPTSFLKFVGQEEEE